MLDEKKKKNIFAEWLEKLQQESWQLELLISGFALFGIWESRDILESFTNFLAVNNPVKSDASIVFKVVTQMLRAAWLVFFTNLLIHVIMRGLWIGAIGLRYVSGDIDYDKLKYSDSFNKYFKEKVGGFDDYIERLEKICSSIFAYTFLLFFIFLSFAFFIIFWIILVALLNYLFGSDDSSSFAISFIVNTVFGFLAFFVFIDFITLGLFKKIQGKNFSKIYGYIYRFYSFITLSFIYRPLLYNFLDTKYTRRLFWFSIPYLLLLTLVLPNFILEANPHFPKIKRQFKGDNLISKHIVISNNYDDLREKNLAISNSSRKRIRVISLSNYEVTNNYASVFIRQAGIDEELLSNKYNITPYRKSGLRHNLFKGKVRDSAILNLENLKSTALLKLIKQHRAIKKDSLNSKLKSNFMKRFNASKDDKSILNLDDYMRYERDSMRKVWNRRIEKEKEKKLLQIQLSLLDANQILIDGVSYNDSLKCKFYIHPNMNEKGLLCYFPTDSINKGEHLLTLNYKIYDKKAKDSIIIRTVNIPFWKF
ncbi:MAG: hypothetical protein L3J20_02275 [Flavobacteriaceae bacterium]|nr:hypothetical protein [Flavobacteriaceae bacterium]